MKNTSDEPWYAVRCVYYHKDLSVYEERTVVFKADNVEDAVKQAEEEAADYCSILSDVEYLDYLDTYHIPDEILQSGSEVFSIMRSISIDRDAYLDRFLDSGTERRKNTA